MVRLSGISLCYQAWVMRCGWAGTRTGLDELRGHVAVKQRESSRLSCLFVTRCRALITSTHRRYRLVQRLPFNVSTQWNELRLPLGVVRHQCRHVLEGGAEFAGPENDGPKSQGWKMQDLENDRPNRSSGSSGKRLLLFW